MNLRYGRSATRPVRARVRTAPPRHRPATLNGTTVSREGSGGRESVVKNAGKNTSGVQSREMPVPFFLPVTERGFFSPMRTSEIPEVFFVALRMPAYESLLIFSPIRSFPARCPGGNPDEAQTWSPVSDLRICDRPGSTGEFYLSRIRGGNF
jgi:hypothetical protein